MKGKSLALFMFMSSTCMAAEPKIIEIIPLSGSISNHKIFMTLAREESKIFGSYFYEKYRTPILVSGNIETTQISISENIDGNKATISAKHEAMKYTGTWSNQKKTYAFSAKQLTRPYADLIKRISIFDNKENQSTLSIDYKNGKTQQLTIDIYAHPPSVIFEDFTFDGYPDLRVVELEAGTNTSYIYYEYNPENGQYTEPPPEIAALINPRVVHDKKIISGISKNGCCSYKATKISSSKIYIADFDYTSNTGEESVTDKSTGVTSQTAITKSAFESNYLKIINTGTPY